MPDRFGRYRTWERGEVDHQRCPRCGGPTETTWRDVTRWPGPEMWWVPLETRCANRDCRLTEQ